MVFSIAPRLSALLGTWIDPFKVWLEKRVARVANPVLVLVFLVRVADKRTIVIPVEQPVTVQVAPEIFRLRIASGLQIANIPNLITILILLTRIEGDRTVVVCVLDPVAIDIVCAKSMIEY